MEKHQRIKALQDNIIAWQATVDTLKINKSDPARIAGIEAGIVQEQGELEVLQATEINSVEQVKYEIIKQINENQIKEQAIQELIRDSSISNEDIIKVTGINIIEQT